MRFTKMKQTQLIQYAAEGNLQKVKEEVKQGVNINIQNGYGNTALIWASMNGNLDMVKFLILKGANINIRNGDGDAALIYASRYGRSDVVEFLNSLKGPASLQHIILNLIEKENVSRKGLPDVLFVR